MPESTDALIQAMLQEQNWHTPSIPTGSAIKHLKVLWCIQKKRGTHWQPKGGDIRASSSASANIERIRFSPIPAPTLRKHWAKSHRSELERPESRYWRYWSVDLGIPGRHLCAECLWKGPCRHYHARCVPSNWTEITTRPRRWEPVFSCLVGGDRNDSWRLLRLFNPLLALPISMPMGFCPLPSRYQSCSKQMYFSYVRWCTVARYFFFLLLYPPAKLYSLYRTTSCCCQMTCKLFQKYIQPWWTWYHHTTYLHHHSSLCRQ